MADTPRVFVKGTHIEICSFRPSFLAHLNGRHNYLAHVDGERGVVEGIKGHGGEMKVSVRLAYNRASVEFPAKVLKPVKKEKT